MANTTNFGWETPDDTDLVKDGAAAMRTLGSAIDTSLVDLKGGTTGQILAKASNTDLDFTWSSDATGIQATIFDAKGDLIAASAADTAARLAIGTNGQVLTADSAETTGMKWATPSTPTISLSGVNCYKSAAQSINSSTATAVTFDQEDFDTDAYHSTSSNTSRITIPAGKGGRYLFIASIMFDGSSTGYRYIKLYKNGATMSPERYTAFNDNVGENEGMCVSYLVNAAATDYFELIVWHNKGSAMDLNKNNTFFGCTYLGA